MIQQLNNWLNSISTYADMSPDYSIRHQVNRRLALCARDSLSIDDWCQLFSTQAGDLTTLAFLHERFSEYSGLDFSRIRAHDRLHGDLHLALVCWHDWVITFCEDFYQQFHIDLSDCFDEDDYETIGELITFLLAQVSASENVSALPGPLVRVPAGVC
mgnify:CR=1 FL=1